MNGVARITFEGGARLMPAQNRYDRELVFEEAEFFARLHGRARLELGRVEWDIHSPGEGWAMCSSCEQPLTPLSFDLGESHLCRRCVRQSNRR